MRIHQLSCVLSALALSACATEVAGAGDGPSSEDSPRTVTYDDEGLVDKAILYFESGFNTAFSSSGLPMPVGITSSSNDWVCVLSQLTGDFNDEGWAAVLHAPNGGGWMGEGRGRAICAARSNFVVPAGGGTLLSEELSARMSVSLGGTVSYDPVKCARGVSGAPATSACLDIWHGDAASFVSKVRGELEGGDFDGVMVSWGSTATTAGKLFSLTTANAGGSLMSTSVTSFFAGLQATPRLVRLRGYNTANQQASGDSSKAGTWTFSVDSRDGFNMWWMAQSGTALCGFIDAHGNYNSTADSLLITERTSLDDNKRYWALNAVAGSPTGSVRGKARCMNYDQRP